MEIPRAILRLSRRLVFSEPRVCTSCCLFTFPSTLFVTFQGNYDEAGKLYERSLAIREKALGPNHPDVAESLNNTARLLKAQVRAVRMLKDFSCGARCCKGNVLPQL